MPLKFAATSLEMALQTMVLVLTMVHLQSRQRKDACALRHFQQPRSRVAFPSLV